MARAPITVVPLTGTTAVADPAGTDANATDDHIVTGVPLEELVLRCVHTSNAERDVTVLAGVNPPAVASGLGDVETSFAAGNEDPVVKWLGPFDSSRFAQADGSLHLDLETGWTGTITAFRLRRGL